MVYYDGEVINIGESIFSATTVLKRMDKKKCFRKVSTKIIKKRIEEFKE